LKRGGSLRTRALCTARTLLRRDGADGLNLRDIAAEAGSGLASLYYHFEDKDRLLAQLAVEGFHELAEALRRAKIDPGEASPARACGAAFIDFALTEPALYALMFQSRIIGGHEAVRDGAHVVFEIFESAVDESGLATPASLRRISLALWAMVRGVSVISLSGGARPDVTRQEVVAETLAGMDLLFSQNGR
jgi:AcrR family transcriptional regulator